MMKKIFLLLLLGAFSLSGCQTKIPKEALELTPQSLEMRQLQTRYFDTKDEQTLLVSSAGLLQDLGFNIEESETGLGYILGSKERDATNAAQITGAVLVALLGGGAMPVDKTQTMRACIVTHPYGEKKERIAVRVTFQRIVWNTQGQATTRECIENPEVYQEFFSKLSKAVFLEANQI
jgi:hypothetical protein